MGVARLPIKITGTPEFYKNANFNNSYGIKATTGLRVTLNSTSMIDGNITTCSLSDGIAYVEFDVNASIAGTIQLTNLLPSDEF